MKTLVGDLLELAECGAFDAIIHGCNCYNTMGGGIAGAIARRYPEVPEADRAFGPVEGSSGKIGLFSYTTVKQGFVVVNAYTQVNPGADARLDAVREAMNRIAPWIRDASLFDTTKRRIAYPKIGCGIGGLSWADVAPIMDEAFAGMDHTLVVLP